MKLDESQVEKIIEICMRNDIEYCAVFGSFARGDSTKDSDLDLLVRFSKPKGIEWLDAAFEIEDQLGVNVDLVTENSLHPLVRKSVLSDLQVLYGKGKLHSSPAHT